MSVDLESHIKAEIALDEQKIKDLDVQIRSKVSKLLDEKTALETSVAIKKKVLANYAKASKK